MRKQIFLTALFLFCLSAAAVSAQDKSVNFSGAWELDAAKSKLGERARIESMTMNVAQTEKEIKIESTTKRAERPEGEMRGGSDNSVGRRGMGRGAGMMGGGGTQSTTYSLDGKEVKIEQDSPMGRVPVSLKAKFEKDGKLKLSSSRTFETPMGSMTMNVKEAWSLSPDGKTLTVTRDQETPRGNVSTELVFIKK